MYLASCKQHVICICSKCTRMTAVIYSLLVLCCIWLLQPVTRLAMAALSKGMCICACSRVGQAPCLGVTRGPRALAGLGGLAQGVRTSRLLCITGMLKIYMTTTAMLNKFQSNVSHLHLEIQ